MCVHHTWLAAHCLNVLQVLAIPEKVCIQFRRVWPKHMAPSVASARLALSCQCTHCSDLRQKLPQRQRLKTTWQAISGQLQGNAALHLHATVARACLGALVCSCHVLHCSCISQVQKEKTTPLSVNPMKSQALYWAAYTALASAKSSSPSSYGHAVGALGTVQSWMPSRCLQRRIQLPIQRSP